MAKEDVTTLLLGAVETGQWAGKGGYQLAGCQWPFSTANVPFRFLNFVPVSDDWILPPAHERGSKWDIGEG